MQPPQVNLPSDTVKITISNKIKPSIFTIGNVLCLGNSTSLTAWNSLYSSLPNVSHQWYRNNVAIPNSNYSQMNYIDQSGFYKVKVTSDNCSGFSDSVQVNVVSQVPKPTILLSSNKTACSNSLLQLDIKYRSPTEIGTEAIYDSLIWKRNGIIIDRKKRNSESLYTYITQSGTYTVIGKQGTCETESDPVEIKIGEPITANITGSTSIYPGQKANLNLNFTGGNAWSYQTSDVATGQTTSSSPTLKTVSPTSTQTYSITSVASNCGVGTVTGNATVTVLPCPTTQAISLNNGNWNTASTWVCGQIPTPTLDTVIEQGHTVSLPNGYQGNTKKLELKGNLTQGAGASVRVSN
jgi:trimeric autotransporter adhesin